MSDFCKSDTIEADDLFESESCVAMSFNTLRSFVDRKGNVSFRFRIMRVKINN